MSFHYSTDFSRRAAERLSAGEPASKLTKELSVSSATLFRWKKQFLDQATSVFEVNQMKMREREKPRAPRFIPRNIPHNYPKAHDKTDKARRKTQ